MPKCGDQRASRRLVLNALRHFFVCGFVAIMRHCRVRLPPAFSFSSFAFAAGASDSLWTHLRQRRAPAGKLRLFMALWIRAPESD